MEIHTLIDHTILKPTTQSSDIQQLCQEAKTYSFAAVCVPPPFVREVRDLLMDSGIKTATVIGFPFGYSHSLAKKAECLSAILDGADELDIVAPIIDIKAGNWERISREWSLLLEVIRLHRKTAKFIIESGELTDEEIIRCCLLANKHKIDFLKTSTGYATEGATVHAVTLMRSHLDKTIAIKASGGIRHRDAALAMLHAGASRLGTSASVQIVNG